MSKTLYRDPVHGKIWGVCAGIANYFNVEIWLVRIIFVSLSLFGFCFIVIIAYIAATLLLDKMPQEDQKTDTFNEMRFNKPSLKEGRASRQLLAAIATRTNKMEQELVRMEAYVTSNEFELNRKFKQL